MILSDVEGHLSYMKPFKVPHLRKQHIHRVWKTRPTFDLL